MPDAAIPVTDLQRDLAGRCGAALTAAGLDGSAASADWLGPLAYSAWSLGLTLASPLTVADADFAAFDTADLPRLLDVAELRALKNALGNYTEVDETVALGGMKLGQVRDGLIALIAAKEAEVKALYGHGVSAVSAGTLDGGFASPYAWWCP